MSKLVKSTAYSSIDTWQWFRSKEWDSLWFLNAYWVFLLFSLVFYYISPEVCGVLAAAVFMFTRLSHIYVSMYLCLKHPAYKALAKLSPWRFMGIPSLIVAFFLLFFSLPYKLFPADTDTRLKIYGIIVFPYLYYHYALQHYGILVMYRSRANQKLSSFHRKFEKLFCHLTVSLTVTALILRNFYELKVGSWSLSGLFRTPSVDWNILAWIIIIPTSSVYFFLELRNQNQSIPKMLYAFSMPLMSLVLTLKDFYLSWMLIDIQHTLAIFGLGGHFMTNYAVIERKVNPKKTMLRYYGYLLLTSTVLSIIYYFFSAQGSGDNRLGAILKGVIPQIEEENPLRIFFFALFVGQGIAHYYFDKLAFSFSDKGIGPMLKKYI